MGFFFVSGNCICVFFGKMAPVTAIIGEISLLSSAIDNVLLHASEHSQADKIQEQITFALRHVPAQDRLFALIQWYVAKTLY